VQTCQTCGGLAACIPRPQGRLLAARPKQAWTTAGGLLVGTNASHFSGCFPPGTRSRPFRYLLLLAFQSAIDAYLIGCRLSSHPVCFLVWHLHCLVDSATVFLIRFEELWVLHFAAFRVCRFSRPGPRCPDKLPGPLPAFCNYEKNKNTTSTIAMASFLRLSRSWAKAGVAPRAVL